MEIPKLGTVDASGGDSEDKPLCAQKMESWPLSSVLEPPFIHDFLVSKIPQIEASPFKKHMISTRMVQKSRWTSRLSSWTNKWFTDWWGSEVLCWSLAAFSVIAILITLNVHSGRPLPDWPSGITLNALISVFATIGEIAMLKTVAGCMSQLKWLWFTRKRPLEEFQAFDNASRGGTGSIRLFWRLRGLHLASLGAAVSMVALAFGPFTQQVLTYPSRRRAVGTATVGQVLTYLENSPGVDDVTTKVFSAVSSGLSVGASLSTVLTTCNTGNCTWPSYPSLGICADVVDVSERLIQAPCNVSKFLPAGYVSVVAEDACFNYTLNERWDGFDFQTEFHYSSNIQPGQLSGQLSTPMLGLISPASPLAHFYTFYPPQSNVNSSPVALNCTLRFCAQTYETSVNSGITTTLVTSNEYLKSDIDPNIPYISTTLGGNKITVRASAASAVYGLLFGTFTGNCQYSSCTTSAAEAMILAANQTSGLPSDVKDAVAAVLNNTAISLTNAIRQGLGGENSVKPLNGTAYSMETYVQAQYVWLVLPIGLVLLTLVFLVATMSKSRRAKTGVWKSSTLPILHGLDHTLHKQLSGLRTMHEEELMSSELEVKLDMGADGSWSFVRA